MTKNTVWIRSQGTDYYLSGTNHPAYTGSGSPWTSESTTPYALALNDVDGPSWAPQPAPGVPQWIGGPPFSVGSRLLTKGYGNVTETLGILLYANSKDNAILLLRQLRAALNQAPMFVPAFVRVTSGTNTGSAEIYTADVSENPIYIQEGGATPGTFLFRATITWVRSPFFTYYATSEVLANGTSWANNGTGTPNNVIALSTGTGDMIYEGSPMATYVRNDSSAYEALYVASVYSRTYSTTGAATSTTSSTGFTGGGTFAVVPVINLVNIPGLRLRCLVRCSITNNAELQVQSRDGTTGTIYWQSASINNSLLGGNYDGVYDLGPVTLPVDRTISIATPEYPFRWRSRSTDGSSSTVIVTSVQWLYYFDFAYVRAGFSIALSRFVFLLPTVQTGSSVTTPIRNRAYYYDGTNLLTPLQYRGTLPRYWSGCSLFVQCFRVSANTTFTDTGVVSGVHYPQFRTIRGGV